MAPRTAVLLMVATLASARVSSARGPEVSLRYSQFVLADGGDWTSLRGWQASLLTPFDSGRACFVLDAGGYYADGSGVHLLLAGPRFALHQGGGVTLSAQVVGGIAFGEGYVLPLVHPGLGLDLPAGNGLALRVQLDWPLVLVGTEVFAVGAARVSAGIVFRPALARARATSGLRTSGRCWDCSPSSLKTLPRPEKLFP